MNDRSQLPRSLLLRTGFWVNELTTFAKASIECWENKRINVAKASRSMSSRRVSNNIDDAIMGAIVIARVLKRKLKCWKDREWKGVFLSGQSA
ncbi:hypothetical protein [Alkalinema sp. FACHB-956]|uniref:hypothetical protein n=1 Tax=Alkalinema sp. FACHB-956 TaxID=2692768 RepID=UPI001689AF5E|nr:hypothetical protein [Alkalinema sp. FACHB-956]MBD2327230.1 hypothetical protein [Alkalinema sp. FACHB-956]